MPELDDPIDRGVIDVRLLAKSLPEDFKVLSGKAKQWIARHSCDSDIRVAQTYVEDGLRWHLGGRQALSNATAALLQSAVIFYARAFDQASNHRSGLNIKSKLGEEQRAFHETLMSLRHESLAHYGPAGEGEDPWSEDIPAIIIERGNWQTMALSKRSLFRKDLAKQFQMHLAQIVPIVSELAEASKQSFEKEFLAVWESDDRLEALLAEALLDVEKIGGWGGPFLGGPRSGRSLRILRDDEIRPRPE